MLITTPISDCILTQIKSGSVVIFHQESLLCLSIQIIQYLSDKLFKITSFILHQLEKSFIFYVYVTVDQYIPEFGHFLHFPRECLVQDILLSHNQEDILIIHRPSEALGGDYIVTDIYTGLY